MMMASPWFAQPFVQAPIKEKMTATRHWPLWGKFTGDRWIPLTKSKYRTLILPCPIQNSWFQNNRKTGICVVYKQDFAKTSSPWTNYHILHYPVPIYLYLFWQTWRKNLWDDMLVFNCLEDTQPGLRNLYIYMCVCVCVYVRMVFKDYVHCNFYKFISSDGIDISEKKDAT